jgi:HEAT repeat protein
MLWWTLQRLKSSNAEARAKAARKLGAAGRPQAVPYLLRHLEDESQAVRLAVIDALGETRHAACAEPVASALADFPGKLKPGQSKEDRSAEAAECEALARAAAKMGSSAVTPLLRALGSEHTESRRWAAFALGLIKDPKAVDPLIQKLGDSRSEVRKSVALALGELGDSRAIQPLIGALAHRDLETRRAAVKALGSLGAEEATDALVKAVADQSDRVQLPAIRALARIGGLRAASCLRAAMSGPRKAVCEAAEAALFSMEFNPADLGERAELAVIRGDFSAAAAAGAAAVPALIAALGFKDPQMRALAAQTLGSISSPESVPALLEAVTDHDLAVQRAAANALANIGPTAREGLESLIGSYDASVARFAASALGKISDPRSVPALLDLIAANRELPKEYPEILDAVRAAVESIGTILTSSLDRIPQGDLTRIAELPEVIRASGIQPSVAVDCAPLRDRAAEELGRRRG